MVTTVLNKTIALASFSLVLFSGMSSYANESCTLSAQGATFPVTVESEPAGKYTVKIGAFGSTGVEESIVTSADAINLTLGLVGLSKLANSVTSMKAYRFQSEFMGTEIEGAVFVFLNKRGQRITLGTQLNGEIAGECVVNK